MSTDPRIQQALQYIREGRKSEAQAVMAVLLRESPRNADYWYIAAGADDGPKRLQLLEKALSINPDHKRARAMLDKLVPSSPVAHTPFIDDMVSSKSVKQPTQAKSSGSDAVTWIIAALIVVVLVGVSSFLSYRYGRDSQLSEINSTSSAVVPTVFVAVNSTELPSTEPATPPPTPELPTAISATAVAVACAFSAEQTDALTEFIDTTETANSTARMSLSGVVLELQRQYRAYQRLDSMDCLDEANTHIESGMSFTVSAFQAFLGDSDSVMVSVDIDLAIKEYKSAYDILERSGILYPDYRIIAPALMIFDQMDYTYEPTAGSLPSRTPRPTLTPLSP